MMTIRLLNLTVPKPRVTRRHKFTVYVLINNKKTGFVRFFYAGHKNLTLFFCEYALTSFKVHFYLAFSCLKHFYYREIY